MVHSNENNFKLQNSLWYFIKKWYTIVRTPEYIYTSSIGLKLAYNKGGVWFMQIYKIEEKKHYSDTFLGNEIQTVIVFPMWVGKAGRDQLIDQVHAIKDHCT